MGQFIPNANNTVGLQTGQTPSSGGTNAINLLVNQNQFYNIKPFVDQFLIDATNDLLYAITPCIKAELTPGVNSGVVGGELNTVISYAVPTATQYSVNTGTGAGSAVTPAASEPSSSSAGSYSTAPAGNVFTNGGTISKIFKGTSSTLATSAQTGFFLSVQPGSDINVGFILSGNQSNTGRGGAIANCMVIGIYRNVNVSGTISDVLVLKNIGSKDAYFRCDGTTSYYINPVQPKVENGIPSSQGTRQLTLYNTVMASVQSAFAVTDLQNYYNSWFDSTNNRFNAPMFRSYKVDGQDINLFVNRFFLDAQTKHIIGLFSHNWNMEPALDFNGVGSSLQSFEDVNTNPINLNTKYNVNPQVPSVNVAGLTFNTLVGSATKGWGYWYSNNGTLIQKSTLGANIAGLTFAAGDITQLTNTFKAQRYPLQHSVDNSSSPILINVFAEDSVMSRFAAAITSGTLNYGAIAQTQFYYTQSAQDPKSQDFRLNTNKNLITTDNYTFKLNRIIAFAPGTSQDSTYGYSGTVNLNANDYKFMYFSPDNYEVRDNLTGKMTMFNKMFYYPNYPAGSSNIRGIEKERVDAVMENLFTNSEKSGFEIPEIPTSQRFFGIQSEYITADMMMQNTAQPGYSYELNSNWGNLSKTPWKLIKWQVLS